MHQTDKYQSVDWSIRTIRRNIKFEVKIMIKFEFEMDSATVVKLTKKIGGATI